MNLMNEDFFDKITMTHQSYTVTLRQIMKERREFEQQWREAHKKIIHPPLFRRHWRSNNAKKSRHKPGKQDRIVKTEVIHVGRD
jgi:hypothetical protein